MPRLKAHPERQEQVGAARVQLVKRMAAPRPVRPVKPKRLAARLAQRRLDTPGQAVKRRQAQVVKRRQGQVVKRRQGQAVKRRQGQVVKRRQAQVARAVLQSRSRRSR